MSILPSDIRVLVDWVESTVFAGEEIVCNIIFRNIATTTGTTRASKIPESPSRSKSIIKQEKIPPLKSNLPSRNARPVSQFRGHRSTLSLNLPTSSTAQQYRRLSPISPGKSQDKRNTHRRSVSIISLGSSEKVIEPGSPLNNLFEKSRWTSKGHGRSESLQRIPPTQATDLLVTSNQRLPTPMLFSPSILHNESTHTSNTTDNSPSPRTTPSDFSTAQNQKIHYRPEKPIATTLSQYEEVKPEATDTELYKRLKDFVSPASGQPSTSFTTLHPTSLVETPCSKEIYTLTTNSSDTISSEFQHRSQSRTMLNTIQTLQPSNLTPIGHQKRSETLIMAYAQLSGSFTLDSSLVNQAPFEEVKKKGIIAGQGGGVVGVETNNRDGGLFRSFGLASIGESLGDLFGSNELSSIKGFREAVSSRSIPLLATPQSILFVDLNLNPGESSCYKYSFRIPLGLPPSHRGKAIKIIYKLVIGIQRHGGSKEQHVKSIEFPFRVLGSVDNKGKLLKHDLMSPCIILKDLAQIKTLSGDSEEQDTLHQLFKPTNSTLADFLSYVDMLLAKSQNKSSLGLFSPSDALGSHRSSYVEEPSTTKEAIELAILRSNSVNVAQSNPNIFEIARSGRKVSVLMLARSSYRLGETILATLDFTDAKIPCYAIHASLESFEKVDTSISLRSEASIFRVTSKTYVTHSESTLFSNRIMFTPTIPTSATPEFVTSGVSLEWRIRVEFVTPRLENWRNTAQGYQNLLEKVSVDNLEKILAAAEILDCESFHICVPLRVYGAHNAIDGDLTLMNWLPV